MDRISGLSDELLIKILLFLPTKAAVSTSLLSKRWECLWMLLPRLKYNPRFISEAEGEMLRCFLNRNLGLHRAPVIESLRLKLSHSHFKPEDVKLYVLAAVSRIIHELKISYPKYPCPPKDILPSCLYASKSLVTLKLSDRILVDVPRFVCLASLKSLHLKHVSYFSEETFPRLLSICPVLKHLRVHCRKKDNIGKLSVKMRSLQSLLICIPSNFDLDGYEIDTPSLEHFKITDYDRKSHYCLIENMPKLMEAHVEVYFHHITSYFHDITSLIGAITSVKRLTISSESEATYGAGFVFNQLEYLKLYGIASDLLARLLKDSPKLQILDLFIINGWKQPSTVPECLLSSLQTFKWMGYRGLKEERDLVVYILENASQLKTAAILSEERGVPKLQMLQELSLSPRASTMCKLAFD